MGAPVIVGNGGIAYRYGNLYIDVAFPGSIAAGDILIGVVYRYQATVSQTFAEPSGWTKLFEIPSGGGSEHEMCFWWRRADGTESGVQRFTWTGASVNQPNWGVMYRITGCVTTGSPFDDTDSAGDTGTTASIPAMTSSGAARLALAIIGAIYGPTLDNNATYYSEFSEDEDTNSVDVTFGAYTYSVAAAGAVSADSFTKQDVTLDHWGLASLLLLPVPGYGNDVLGVASANIGKVNGVATANVSKVIGA